MTGSEQGAFYQHLKWLRSSQAGYLNPTSLRVSISSCDDGHSGGGAGGGDSSDGVVAVVVMVVVW